MPALRLMELQMDTVGSAPDIGAYEHGGEYWIPGITWDVADTFGDDFIEPEAMEFKPTTKEELQMAVDLWVSDNTTALSTYGPINGWDVSLITDMHDLFHDKTTFNDDIGSWDVSNVTDMNRMFRTCRVFNQDISGWDVSSVTTMNGCFATAGILIRTYQAGMCQM